MNERGECVLAVVIVIAIIVVGFFLINGLSMPTVTNVRPEQIPTVAPDGLFQFIELLGL